MKKIYLVCLILLGVNALHGQVLFPEVFSCFGGQMQNDAIQLTWTAGEPLFTTVQNENSILTQGFNQSVYVTAITSNVEELSEIALNVYPNPTASFITVSVQSSDNKLFSMALFDLQGKSVYELKSNKSSVEIDLSAYNAGTYLLNVSDGKRISKTFKIQKVK